MDKLELKPITLAALAVITGIFGGVVILAISLVAGWPWVYSVISAAAVSGITWLALMRRYLAIMGGENSNGRSSFQPAKIYPAETPLNVNVNDFDNPYPRGKRGIIRHKKKLPELARLILVMGKSYSYADLEGKGKLFNRTEFEHVRSDMMDLGLLCWKNPDNHRDGVHFTVGGIAFLRRVQAQAKTSPPLRTKFSPGITNVE